MNTSYPFRRTRVKICGLTRAGDVQAAVQMGADAIGLVLYPPSPRYVDIRLAAELAVTVPPFVTVVGLFVNPEPSQVREVLSRVRIDLLQFHGEEDPGLCGSFDRPWIKALRVQPDMDLLPVMASYTGASGFLLDAWHPDARGGTGHSFDWNLVPPEWADSVILAGGLTSANVTGALRAVRPYALDVSSGVEGDEKGIKDVAKMAAFLEKVHGFDSKRLQDDRTL